MTLARRFAYGPAPVHECIRTGFAGIRLDDQAIEAAADAVRRYRDRLARVRVERYRAAIDARNSSIPTCRSAAQCYDAEGGGMDESSVA